MWWFYILSVIIKIFLCFKNVEIHISKELLECDDTDHMNGTNSTEYSPVQK